MTKYDEPKAGGGKDTITAAEAKALRDQGFTDAEIKGKYRISG